MAKLLGKKSCVVVASGLTAVVSDMCCTSKEVLLTVPDKIKPNKEIDADDSSTDIKLQIVAGDISESEKYIVLCTSDKRLILWETFKCSPLSIRISPRVGSKVKFAPSEKTIILADKSGDAYEFSVIFPDQEGKLILGHLSMLLDVLVTPDEKFVITCDRDEKIRVSCYPNAYNIQSYCLGHKEFVTAICLLPHDERVLVSSSGDGSIRFWDYKMGIEMYRIQSCMNLPPSVDVNTNEQDDCSIFPITVTTCCNLDSFSSVICCCLSKVHSCFVYQISGNSKSISHKLVQTITLQAEPWDIICFNKRLWVISSGDEFLHVFVWNTNTNQFETSTEERILSIVTDINSNKGLFKNVSPAPVLTLLYKRKYDNVQEYHNRKKHRLASSANSSEYKDTE